MNSQDKDEKLATLAEYNALKKFLGGMLLENNNVDPDEITYFTRKFNEARQRVGGNNAQPKLR